MNWKTISALIGRQHEEPGRRVYDFRVTAGAGSMVPAEMAERLTDLVTAVPLFSKRDVILTGLAKILETCEPAPGQPVPELKLGAFKSQGQTSLPFRVPLDLDARLINLINSRPGISKRDLIVAGTRPSDPGTGEKAA